ncbi:MAG: hypothetical protein V5A62_01280 [Haloarculaceae archaeon]
MRTSRRGLLWRGAAVGTVGLAGCVDGLAGGDEPRGTADLPRRLWFETVSLSDPERESIDPIVFGDLSADEREIVRTALEEGEYTLERDQGPPAFERLRDRIEARTGNGETLEVYLRCGESYYRVGFADGDHVIAHPDG